MHIASLLCPLFLAPLALAAPALEKRDAQTVYDDISGIDSAVQKLTAALTAYEGGILATQPVFDAAIAIHNVNRQGFADAKATTNLTSAESKRIVQHVSDSVGVSIPAGLKVLEAKKPLFDTAQVSSVIKSTIDLLKYDHETFSLAVGAKLSFDQVGAGVLAAGKIDASLQAASLYYII
uniref:Putative cell wall galactomannoprotein n=1 Tax=Leptoxyphium fumago TaxID=5474 RepID=A0A2I7YBS7_LEPFU|nr:putative cell wall galactomannoprotein [Leptoxyphium fumago]